MSSNLKVNTILPSTGTTIGIGTVGGLINVVGNIDVNSTSGISTFNDLEIADKIIHTGDTNTTIRFPAVDTITAETGGSERLRIDSSGRVLIGTTTAGTGSGDDLTISNSSNMGLTLRSTSSNYCNIYFSDATSGTATYEGYISYNHATDSLEFATVHTERLRITSGGELLVGTQNKINTSPTKFQIASNDATGSAILARFNANSYSSYLDFYKSRSNTLGTAYVVNSNDHLGALRFYAADGSNSGYTTAAEIYGSCDGGSGASGDMPGRITFHTRPDGAGQSMQERLRITSDGKVVAGGSGAGYPSRLQSHGAGNLLDLNSTSGAAVIRFYESGSGRFDLRTNNGSSGLNFYDSLNGVERIRINQHGGLRVFAAASDPTGIQAGEIYYNTTTNRLRVYNGSRWLNPDENKDPYASSVVCLFNGDSYTDLTGRHTLTQVGAGGLSNNYMSPVGSTSTYRMAHSNSTGNYMNITGNLGDFRLDDGNWTMEFWVRTTGTNGYHHYFVADGQGSKGTFKGYTNNGSVTEMAYFYSSNGTGVIYNPGGSPFAYNDWQHYAWDRTGSTTRFYLDGVVRASSTASYPGGNPTLCHIGKWNNEAIEFYIDNFRFTRGVARYGGNGFEVPRTKYSSG